MASDTFGFLVDQNTLIAVILGAILATIGGFVATATERYLDKRERERNAALFFGELLSTMSLILAFARSARSIGDPYGPITMRFLRATRREIDIYDRNRESLFDLRHHELRARIHTTMLRLTMPLDGIFDASREIAEALASLKNGSLATDALRRDAEDRLEELRTSRNSTFDFILETDTNVRTLIKDLEPLARHSFEKTDKAVRSAV